MTARPNMKYIVLTAPRSGSTWLMDMLHRLPGVTAQGELFLPRARSAESEWDADFHIPRFVETPPTGIPFRPFSTFAYLNHFYRTPGVVGFKLMFYQLRWYPEILAYLYRHRVGVIHLIRRNHMDVILSKAYKAKLGKAHVLQGRQAADRIQVALPTRDLVRRLERLERGQKRAQAFVRRCGLPFVEIAYEDLAQDIENFCRVQDFLGVETQEYRPQSAIVKSRKGKPRETLSNYEQVHQTLEGTRFAGLLE